MLDFQKWIEKTFAAWTGVQLGLAAIGFVVAAAVAQLLFDAFQFEQAPVDLQQPGKTDVLQRWHFRTDPNSFARISKQSMGTADQAYDIALIGASALDFRKHDPQWDLWGRNQYFVSDVLANYIKTVDNQPPRLHQYYMSSIYMGDQRRAVLDAVNSPEIDAYVLPINFLFDFNQWVMFTASYQRADILGESGLTWFDAGFLARVLRPSEVGLEIVSELLPLARDRVQLAWDHLGGKVPFPTRRSDKAHVVNDLAALAKWLFYFYPASKTVAKDPSDPTNWRRFMFMADTREQSWGFRLLEQDIRTLAATGKPVVFYVQPINPAVKMDQRAVAQFNSVINAVKLIAERNRAPNVVIDTDTAWDAPQPYLHRDVFHLAHGQGLIQRIVDDLAKASGKQIERTDPQTFYRPAK